MRASRHFSSLAAAVALTLTGPSTGAAADVPVGLELVLAVDTSRSIDFHEAQLQRQGYVAALMDPKVVAAIQSGLFGRIVITYMEWSGLGYGSMTVGWSAVSDAASAAAFAQILEERPLLSGRRTSISHAITMAMTLFDGNGFEGTRRMIDISGDGPNNQGVPVTAARDLAVADGIAGGAAEAPLTVATTRQPARVRLAATGPPPCDIGERRWRDRQGIP